MIYADRVKFVTESTGTGAVQEGSAVAPFRQLAAVAGSGGRRFCYLIQNAGASEWEQGFGTYTAGTPGSLSRDTVLLSSNADAAVNFSAGTKTVSVVDAAVFHGAADGEMHGALTGGTGAALTANFYPQPFALRDFMRVAVRLHEDLEAEATFNPNGLGAGPIMELRPSGLAAVAAGRFKAGMILVLRRDPDGNWQIANGMVQDVVPAASEEAAGIVERATLAEARAGSDTSRYVSPAQIAAGFRKGAAPLADGGTIEVPASGGGYFEIAGSTPLTAIALEGGNSVVPPGFALHLRLLADKNVAHSAALILPDGVDFAGGAGDQLDFVYEGAGVWRLRGFQRATTPPSPSAALLEVATGTSSGDQILGASLADTGLEVTVEVTDATAIVFLSGLVQWSGTGSGGARIFWQIWKGSALSPLFEIRFEAAPGAGTFAPNWFDVPGIGTHTYRLRARREIDSSAQVYFHGIGTSDRLSFLIAQALKPADAAP